MGSKQRRHCWRRVSRDGNNTNRVRTISPPVSVMDLLTRYSADLPSYAYLIPLCVFGFSKRRRTYLTTSIRRRFQAKHLMPSRWAAFEWERLSISARVIRRHCTTPIVSAISPSSLAIRSWPELKCATRDDQSSICLCLVAVSKG